MKRTVVVLVAALLAVLPSPGFAQSTSSVIRGTVVDANGVPLPGVRVLAKSPTQIGGPKSAYTDAEGSFRIVGLSPGVFEVSATAQGLKPVVQQNVELSVNAPSELMFFMEVAAESETVTVIEKPATVNAAAANVKETFTQEFIERVPLTQNSYQNVADQAVGWNATGTNFRVRGGNVYDNIFTIDGFSLADPVNRQTAAFVNFDAIGAIEVQSAAYGAENATAQGGVLNIVSRSGTNDYRFGISSTYTDQRMQFWTDQTDRPVPTRNLYVNGNVSGPLIKDKLWLFFSNETQSQVTNLGGDPSGLFQTEHPSRQYDAYRFLTKLDWQITGRNRLSLISLVTPERTDNAIQRFQTDALAERRDVFGAYFTGLTWQSVLTDNLVFKAQAGVNYLYRESLPQSCASDPACLARPSTRELVNNVTLGNHNLAEVSRARSLQINSDLQWFGRAGGDHSAKLGFRASFNENPFRTAIPGGQILTLNNGSPDRLRTSCLNDPREGECASGWLESKVSGENAIAFVQDAWKPVKTLTLTLGAALSHGRQRDENGKTVISVLAPSPHVSAAWDATGDGKTVVRASFANYVDTGFLALARYASRAQFAQECRWDAATGTFSAGCNVSGGVVRNTINRPCGPTDVGSDGQPCANDIPTPRTWEYTIGGEREIWDGIALGGDFIYRRYTNQWEDAEVNRVWNAGGTALREDGGYKNGRPETIMDLSPRAENHRRYAGITIFLRKYVGRFQALIAWTRHSQYGSPLGYNSDFLSNPSQTLYQYGYVATDQRNEAKFMGHIELTPWLVLGTNVIYRNGPPYSRYYYNTVQGDFRDLRSPIGTDPRNPNDANDDVGLREPDAFLAYAQLRVRMKPLIGHNVEGWVDAFNLAGNREVQGFVETDGTTWGLPVRRRPPPFFRVGLRYTY